MSLDLADDHDQDEDDGSHDRALRRQSHHGRDREGDRRADQRDEGGEELQQCQRQGQRDSECEQGQSHEHGVGPCHQDDAVGVSGERAPGGPARDHHPGPGLRRSWSQNQFHCRSPEWMKKTEQNNARTNTVTTSTSRPAPLTAVLMRAERWLDRY